MPVLSTELRNKLEKVVVEARDVAEAGARIALESLAVHHHEPYAHMDEAQRTLRNRLRAHARQLGDQQEPGGRLAIPHLVREVAYEHWHRMLFAQFLAENNLLIEPEMGIAITMEECEELAREAGEDPRAMAARFAQQSLPQIFRQGDPVLELSLPPETQQTLDRLLDSLSTEVFIADDSLGWTYQFWQSKRKKEVNESGNKIGADELPAVTQLFTEHYMVQFLYHNTIGAWHAGKVLAANPELAETAQSEQELRDAVRLKSLGGYDFEYLRFVRSTPSPLMGEGGSPTGSLGEGEDPWRPAAGTFDGWPKTPKEITVLDPCCGSGHFLNEGFQLLVRLRMDEERLALKDAIRAVLAENLHGLEIDPRCTQIAAFNVALAAWKLADKPIELPPLHIACSGLSVGATKGKWISLAGDDPRLRAGMGRLYDLFEQAPTLGSLINPKAVSGDLLTADFSELQPLLANALASENRDEDTVERVVAARGMSNAADVLSRNFTLTTTNVPYLSRGKFAPILLDYCESRFRDSKSNLAACFVQRCIDLVHSGGTVALVSMQTWLFQVSYARFRKRLLSEVGARLAATLGMRAFQTQMWDFAVCLLVLSTGEPSAELRIRSAAIPDGCAIEEIPLELQSTAIQSCSQESQAKNPGSVWNFREGKDEALLGRVAESVQGIKTGDDARVRRYFWEFKRIGSAWRFFQSTVKSTRHFTGGRKG